MSDGLSDATRAHDDALRLELCADRLADVLVDVTDAAFGIAPNALDIANRELRRAGVKLVKL